MTDTSHEDLPSWLRDRWIVTVLALIAICLYGTTLRWDFVFDDPLLISENEKIRSLGSIFDFFTSGVWHNTALGANADRMDSYRPLHMAYLIASFKLWGGKAFGFHLANVLLQGVNSILVYLAAKRLSGNGNLIYPFLGALLFAVHPTHTEAVSWISASADLLTTLFLLSSFLIYSRAAEADGWFPIGMAVLLFAAALLTKEVAIVFPVVISAYDILVRKRRCVSSWLPFVAVALLFLVVRKAVLGDAGSYGMVMNQDGWKRLFEFVCGYIQLAAWPWPITIYQGTPRFGAGVIVFALLVLAALLYFAVQDRRRIFCLVWSAAFILPPLALCFSPQLETRYYFADRYLYLPSVGFSLLFALLLPRLFESRRQIMLAACVPVFAGMGAITAWKTFDWRNDVTLFSVFIRNYPERLGNYVTVGLYYEKERDFAKANEIYRNALGHMRNDKDRASVYDGLGRTYALSGQTGAAVAAFQMAFALNPRMSSALVGLGNLSRDYDQASDYYTRALELNGNDVMACNNLVSLNLRHGYREKAAYFQAKCRALRGGAAQAPHR